MSNSYLFRKTILTQLEAAYPVSLPIKTIIMGLEISGFKDCNDIDKHIAYLQQKNFLEIVSSEICPSYKRYKITASGIDFLNEGAF